MTGTIFVRHSKLCTTNGNGDLAAFRVLYAKRLSSKYPFLTKSQIKLKVEQLWRIKQRRIYSTTKDKENKKISDIDFRNTDSLFLMTNAEDLNSDIPRKFKGKDGNLIHSDHSNCSHTNSSREIKQIKLKTGDSGFLTNMFEEKSKQQECVRSRNDSFTVTEPDQLIAFKDFFHASSDNIFM